MRIAVAGGTGVVGRYAVLAGQQAGHDVVVLSRSAGVDVVTGEGLAAAMAAVEVVVDALNISTQRGARAEEFFTTTSRRLQDTASAAGCAHLVTLSILGIDRVPGYGYYEAKLAQERVVHAGPVPATVLRAAQFHEFPAQVLARMRRGPLALVPRMRSQPVAARTVGAHLVRLAVERPGGTVELAGPQVHEVPDLARRIVAARGERVRVVAVPVPGAAGRAMSGDALLETADTVVDGPTYDDWLLTDDALRVPLRR